MSIRINLQFCGIIIIILTQIFNSVNTTESETICPYEYTVDLSHSKQFRNNSYLYDNDTLITPDLVQDYTYIIVENRRKPVRRHKRGCICKVKQCLRFCSKSSNSMNFNNFNEKIILNVTLNNGTIVNKDLMQDFHPLYGRICTTTDTDLLGPKLLPNYNWTLYENSLLQRNRDQKNFTLNEYCFELIVDGNDEILYVRYTLLICRETLKKMWFQNNGVFICTPFFVVTIILSNCLQQLRNSRGKCYITYLCFVTLSYVMLSCLGRTLKFPYDICQIYGYVLYFAITSYLTWTCLLSYDTWKCLTDMVTKQPSYLKYCYIGCGIPALVTFLAFILDNSNIIPHNWKPGIGQNHCGIDTYRWSGLFYYFLPGIAVFFYSLALYIMILRFSWTNKEKLRSYLEEIQELQIERFFLYFRIFILMGSYWFLNLITYLIKMMSGDEGRIYLYIFFVSGILKSFQGVFVFLVFVCRRPALNEIKERFGRKSSADQRKISINTSMEMRIEAFRNHFHQ